MRATRLAKLWLKALRTDANTIASVPLSVTKLVGQTSNIMEVRDTDDTTVLAKIDSAGKVSSVAGTAAGNVATIDGTQTLTNKTLTTPVLTNPTYAVNTLPVKVAHAIYSFAVDGGVQGAITPATTASIPDNAIVIGAIINSTTAVTSLGAATVSIGTTAGSSATSIIGATGKASYSADALVAATPDFSGATFFKMSAAGSINVTVGTADLTAGVIEIWVFYMTASA